MADGNSAGASGGAEWEIIGKGVEEAGAAASIATSNEAIEAVAFSVATSKGDGDVPLSASEVGDGADVLKGLSSVSLDTSSSVAATKLPVSSSDAAMSSAGVGAALVSDAADLKPEASTTVSAAALEKERILLELEDARSALRKASFASDAKVAEVGTVHRLSLSFAFVVSSRLISHDSSSRKRLLTSASPPRTNAYAGASRQSLVLEKRRPKLTRPSS